MTERPDDTTTVVSARAAGLEGRIALLLRVGTYAAIGCIAIGVLVMLVSGRSPLDAAPPLAPERLITDLLTLQPSGFLWLGLILVLLTPASRVAVSAVSYARSGDRPMAAIATLVLFVIATGVLLGIQGA